MTLVAIWHICLYLAAILILVQPLGYYIAWVHNQPKFKLEKRVYCWLGVQYDQAMDWRQYLKAMLCCNACALLLGYMILRWQHLLPLNPQQFLGLDPLLAFNSSVSFITNTGWQAYAGEATLSYLSQSLVVTVMGFISAATGLSVFFAFVRGLVPNHSAALGNYWVDMTRSILFILLPLAMMVAICLTSVGVMQNFKPYVVSHVLDPTPAITTQTIPMGPVASLEGIKIVGSYGAGFFATNSAHPFANPKLFSNFISLIGMLLIPAALCYTFGALINDRRQGQILFAAMTIIFVVCALVNLNFEHQGNPLLSPLGVTPSGNMEGKEMRIGISNSAIMATVTAATGNGSVNSMLDSFMPMSGGILILLMHVGEIIFGGIGSGLYSMIVFVLVAVFIAGLMVGRTPEYLGKKIAPFEMKIAVLIVFLLPLLVIIFAAFACVSPSATKALGNPEAHGFSEILYALTSLKNNNGSTFAGLSVNNNFYNILGIILMLIGRYWTAIAALAIAGSLAPKKVTPINTGTLSTHSLAFLILLLMVICLLGGLTIVPTLALGPIAEQFNMWSKYVG